MNSGNIFDTPAPAAAQAPSSASVLSAYGLTAYTAEQLSAMPAEQLVQYRTQLSRVKEQLSGDVIRINTQIEQTEQKLSETRQQAQQHFGADTVEGLRTKEAEVLSELQAALV